MTSLDGCLQSSSIADKPPVTRLRVLLRDSAAVYAVVEHMYSIDGYTGLEQQDFGPHEPFIHDALLFHARVFSMAYQLDVPATELLAKRRLDALARVHWQDPGFGIFLAKFWTGILYSYELRLVTFDILHENGWTLLDDEGFRAELTAVLGLWWRDYLI